MKQNAYQIDFTQLLEELQTSEFWLSSNEAKIRNGKYGENAIQSKDKNSALKILLEQFTSPLVIILIIAAIVSWLIGEGVDAIIICGVVVLNALLGFFQEYKADKAIQSLKKMAGLKSKVLRDGEEMVVEACELTIWDVILLEAWDKIPADARLFEAVNLEVEEAILTWESVPVEKHIATIDEASALADMKNMVFSWTMITKWRWKAVITAIWMDTEMWKIAWMLEDAPEKTTTLEKKLNNLSKILWIAAVVICIIIFIVYRLVSHLEFNQAFLAAVALAVAAIPEWLPAVVTISLWLWVKRFVKKNVLVRRLSSVETLGSVNIICTDKTGTLTKNEMTVTKLFVNGEIVDVSGRWYSTKWEFSAPIEWLRPLLSIGMLCNTAKLHNKQVIGDPTEWALLVSAYKAWMKEEDFFNDWEWIDEIPFDSERKRMSEIFARKVSVENADESKYKKSYISKLPKILIYTKWAIEWLLPLCDTILINWEIKELDKETKKQILDQASKFSEQALRVLGFAFGEWKEEKNLTFVWLQAMIDPPREEVKDSIERCKNAWIRVIMITWDNKVTAWAIARELWIEWEVITWFDFEKSKKKAELLDTVWVIARVNPSDKQEIVNILRWRWNVVAMTWDGVNDAPSIKAADIWVGMWITWTDVTKEAADMILTDDNFKSIVNAVEEWRWIYDNIQKFVNYMIVSNICEIAILFVASLIWVPIPLLAIHLLWLNVITDWLPAIALWVDPINPNVMNRKPRKASQGLIDGRMILNIILLSSSVTIWTLILFLRWYHIDLEMARSAVFLFMAASELVKIQIIRSQYWLSFFSNKWLIWALLGAFGLAFSIVYIPGINTLFDLQPLSAGIWEEMWIILGIFIIIWTVLSEYMKKSKRFQKWEDWE